MKNLSAFDLSVAASLVLLLALFCFHLRMKFWQQVVVSAARAGIQLSLIGFVLHAVFANAQWFYVALLVFIMILAAGREITARQKFRFKHRSKSLTLGFAPVIVSSITVTALCLVIIIQEQPWYNPQYAIPLLGMLLGNTMTVISLAINHFIENVRQQRHIIEQRLALGQTHKTALHEIFCDSLRTSLIPIVNSMAIAGIVSLPGMMTGQILAGGSPLLAAKYQIMVLFLIAGCSGIGSLIALLIAREYFFDNRQRLRVKQVFK